MRWRLVERLPLNVRGAATCGRYLRIMLQVAGVLLLFAGGFPVMVFLHFEEPLQTALIASKLVMLPVGAMCLLAATQMRLGGATGVLLGDPLAVLSLAPM